MIYKLVYLRQGAEREEEIVECMSEHAARQHAAITLRGGATVPDIHEDAGWRLSMVLSASARELKDFRRRVRKARDADK